MAKEKKVSASPKVTKKRVTKKPKVSLGSVGTDASKEFHLEVNVNDGVYKGDADTLAQALSDFVNDPFFPQAIKTKVFLKYSKGEVQRHKLLSVPRARAIFTRMSFDPNRLAIIAERLTHELTA